MLSFKTFLKEVIISERYPTLYLDLLKYKNKFIHFSNGISIEKNQNSKEEKNEPMFQINIKKSHRDPYALYFYPISWLLKHDDFNLYGTTMKYYYIVDIKTNDERGVKLNSMTEEKALEIARRNGWDKHLRIILTNPEKNLKPFFEHVNMPKSVRKLAKPNNPSHYGFVFYCTADALINFKEGYDEMFYDLPKQNFTWNSCLKGVSFLYDKGKGIINANEPAQIAVLDKRIIKKIKFGINKDVSLGQGFYIDLAKKLIEKLNGKVTSILKGHVFGEFNYNGFNVNIKTDGINYCTITYFENGIQKTEKIKNDPSISMSQYIGKYEQMEYLYKQIINRLKTIKFSSKREDIMFDVETVKKVIQPIFNVKNIELISEYKKEDDSILCYYTSQNDGTFSNNVFVNVITKSKGNRIDVGFEWALLSESSIQYTTNFSLTYDYFTKNFNSYLKKEVEQIHIGILTEIYKNWVKNGNTPENFIKYYSAKNTAKFIGFHPTKETIKNVIKK